MLSIADGLIEVPFISEGQIKKTIQSAFLDQEEQKQYEEDIIKDAIDQSKNEAQNNENIAKNSQIPPKTSQNQPKTSQNQQNRVNLGYKEEDVKKLVDLSFSREAAIRALKATGGDPEKAAALQPDVPTSMPRRLICHPLLDSHPARLDQEPQVHPSE